MTNAKNTKRALLASVLSMVLSISMLVGSTFAWFTDTAASGKNRIVAGNLDIELQGKIDGKYVDLSEDSEGSLFDETIKWEPGQICYRELKVVNRGSLATKFSVNIDDDAFEFNYVVEPNEKGTYTGTNHSLMDVIRVAVYEGSFRDLVDEVNKELGTTYKATDRNVVKAALENGVISGDLLANTDPDYGSLYENELLEPGKAAEFTLIAYWAFEEEDIRFWEIEDNNYNLKNGRKTAIPNLPDDILYEYDDEDNLICHEINDLNLVSDDSLYIDFDIKVFATQTPSETDSFGIDYDSDIMYIPDRSGDSE